jgi:uncharacterized 2Fe-2S/4Fe-4S cluster protein (DUF4445 family)
MATIELKPAGLVLHVPDGTPLQEVLFPHGAEFPCAGKAKCKGCRVRVIAGEIPPHPVDLQCLSKKDIAAGWRLGCRAVAHGYLVLEMGRWSSPILADDTVVQVEPKPGYGIAIDLGTTTLVAQVVDRKDGRVLGVRSALNPQAKLGADLMTRLDHAHRSGGAAELRDAVRGELGRMVGELVHEVKQPPALIVIAGNTAMHHLFGGLDPAPLCAPPFHPVDDGLQEFRAADLGWTAAGEAVVRFLPCLGGFVGSDLTAGILATRLHEHPGCAVLVDLGTNGEIVAGGKGGLVCASTAAGPAFEGAGISIGMRAATGAIGSVRRIDGRIEVEVLGGGAARGICGSGLVDAVASCLELGWVRFTGRLEAGRTSLPLVDALALAPGDIRHLQLAKGAVAAGIHVLLKRLGKSVADVDRVFLAGAFGNYVNRASAQRIGLLPFAPELVHPSGNTSLLGARLALSHDDHHYRAIRAITSHVELKREPGFDDIFVDNMLFPETPTVG